MHTLICFLTGLHLIAGLSFAQSVTFELVEDYGNSYQARGTITNTTGAPLTSWLVTFSLDAPLDQNWNSILQPGESDPSS